MDVSPPPPARHPRILCLFPLVLVAGIELGLNFLHWIQLVWFSNVHSPLFHPGLYNELIEFRYSCRICFPCLVCHSENKTVSGIDVLGI